MDAPSPEPAKKPDHRIVSLPRRFRRNVSTGYLKTGSSALITLVMTPVLIAGLGTEAFGIWIVIGSLALYREILQFGFSTATPKYVAEYAALDDQERRRPWRSASSASSGAIGSPGGWCRA